MEINLLHPLAKNISFHHSIQFKIISNFIEFLSIHVYKLLTIGLILAIKYLSYKMVMNSIPYVSKSAIQLCSIIINLMPANIRSISKLFINNEWD